jgi:hypothetical protein
MAEQDTTWPETTPARSASKLTRQHVEDLAGRLQDAINAGQLKVTELTAQLNELNAHISSLGDARKRLEPLIHGTQYLDAIEHALAKLSAPHTAKKSGKV